jgi:hypothetical protein
VSRAGSPLAAVALGLAGLACSANEPRYFPPGAPLESGDGDMPAAVTLAVPFRTPSDKDREKLASEGQKLGQELPWLRSDRVAVSLLYTITNLGEQTGAARLEVDGASEFAAYDAAGLRAAAAMGGQDTDDEAVLALIRPTPVTLAAGEVYRGTVREDDFDEAALDLDAIARFGAVPASVLINLSSVNPIGLEMVPPGHVRPALFQVTVRFVASQRMRLDFLLRVRDEDRQLARGSDPVFTPDPPGYMPPPPMPPP